MNLICTSSKYANGILPASKQPQLNQSNTKNTAKFEKRHESKLELTAESVVGHAEKGEAIQGEYVEDVPILGEANPGIGVRRELFKDPASHGACVSGDGAKLGQDDGSASDDGVEYRHVRPRLGPCALSTPISIESKSHGPVLNLIDSVYLYIFLNFFSFKIVILQQRSDNSNLKFEVWK